MFRSLLIIIMGMLLSGCLGPVQELYPEDEKLRPVNVYVISHGWHVGLAIKSSVIREYLPEHETMPESRYLTFGWGDARYYPAKDPGVGVMLRAALFPTKSVLHVVGIDRPVEDYFTSSTIIKIMVSEKGAGHLAEFIADQFRRDQNGEAIVAEEGLYRNSRFYEAKGYYFFPKTSNTWTARALRTTGFPITPFYAITSGNVIHQARKHGEVIRLK